MYLSLFCLASPAITFVVHALVERTIFRMKKPRSPQNAVAKYLVLMSLIYGAVAVYLNHTTAFEDFLTFAYAFITTLGFGYGYFHVFNMSETARRIHIVVLIYEYSVKGNREAKEELARYDAKRMIEVRVRRLLEMGGLILENGKYKSYGHGLALSGLVFRAMRPLFYGSQKGNH